MDFEVIKTVQELTNKYGSEIYRDSRELKSYLNDFYPGQHVRDIRLLCDSIDQKIPVEIANYTSYEIEEFLYGTLVTRLYDNLGISQDLAEEAVDNWINILGKSHLKGASVNNNTGNSNPYHQQSRPRTALNYTPVDSNTVFMNNPPNIPNSASEPKFDNKKS